MFPGIESGEIFLEITVFDNTRFYTSYIISQILLFCNRESAKITLSRLRHLRTLNICYFNYSSITVTP